MRAVLANNPAEAIELRNRRLFGAIFLAGAVATGLSEFFDYVDGRLTRWDLYISTVDTAMYFVSSIIILLRPQWITAAILLSAIPTEIYQQGVMYLAVHKADAVSYYAAAGSGPFFPLIYLVMFIMLPRRAAFWSALNCIGFVMQYLLNITMLVDPAPSPTRIDAEHVLFQVMVAHPVYVLTLSYIVNLRERLHAVQQESFRQKEGFLAMMTHEIRNQLQTMVGAMELLELRLKEPSERRAVERLQDSATQLQTYLSDVNELTKLEDPTLRIEEADVDLLPLLENIREDWLPRAENNGLSLELRDVAALPLVRTDAARVRQIVSNLVSNALKYTEQGGVMLTARRTDDDAVAIEVADTGIGIDERYLERIFLPHIRLDNAVARKPEGSGMGLAIVQRLAGSLGGAISVKSRPGEGSCFVLAIPIRRNKAQLRA
jgi:signal transduction histidine kinase